MGYFILKRMIGAIPVAVGLSLLAFFMIRLVPGDTATAILGIRYTEDAAAELRQSLGLDQAIWVQYTVWLSRALQGNFGSSSLHDMPVIKVIYDRILVTAELTFWSLSFGCIAGMGLGIWAAMSKSALTKSATQILSILGVSIPNFWLGTSLIMIFSLYLGWLPSGGYVSWHDHPWEHLKGLLMPTLALGSAVTAVIGRMTQSSMEQTLGQPYIMTARAKGLSNSAIIRYHALKNGFIPILTVISLQAGSLLGGSIVIEHVFSLPGFGLLVLEAIGHRDYALLQGIILTTGSFFIILNILTDLIYRFLDPRIGRQI